MSQTLTESMRALMTRLETVGEPEPLTEGRFVEIDDQPVVYHATHVAPGLVLTNRQVKTYDSLGTWLTSSRAMALEMYGPHVSAYRLPPGRYIEADPDQDMHEMIANCLPIIRKHLGAAHHDHISDHPMDARYFAFIKQVRQEIGPERFRTMGWDSISEYLYGKDPKRYEQWKAYLKSRKLYRDVLLSQGYNQEFREFLERCGTKGFVWRARNWDGSPEPQDIYLIFHAEDLHPIADEQP